MPQPASALGRDPLLRVLLMGFGKIGKTTCSITSLSRAVGHGYVLCCGDKYGMQEAQKQTTKFDFDVIQDENDMEASLKEARAGAKASKYKWILVDDYSLYASWLHDELRDSSARQNKSGLPNGMQYYPELKQRLLNIPRRLFDVGVHVIFASHWISPSPEISGQRAKSGVGILPMIPGSAREELPALFRDVIFMEKEDDDRRVFRVNPEGVWGPGCYSVKGTHTIDADFGVFLKLAAGELKPSSEKAEKAERAERTARR